MYNIKPLIKLLKLHKQYINCSTRLKKFQSSTIRSQWKVATSSNWFTTIRVSLSAACWLTIRLLEASCMRHPLYGFLLAASSLALIGFRYH